MGKMFFKNLIFLSTFLFYTFQVHACPFCGNGGMDTALFIVVVFGFFILSAVFFMIYLSKRGFFKEEKRLANRPLEAEKRNPK